MTPDDARALFFETLRGMNPDAKLTQAIDRAETRTGTGTNPS